MKGFKNCLFILLTVFLMIGSFNSIGWAVDQDEWVRKDPMGQTWSVFDLLIARPFGIMAGIAGTGVFVISLPFTIPTGGVRDAADMFIVQPFKFSFVREFPDGDI